DMDALPIREASDVPYRSQHDGRIAATTATRPCCWAQRVTLLRHETSLAQCISFFSQYVFKNIFLRHLFEAVMAALHASMEGRSCSANYSISHPLSYATRRLRL